VEKATCVIEHHAVLYGLLAKEAICQGLEARCALGVATARYGWERGQRMAQYAKEEGVEATMPTYAIFKEWRPPALGQMVPGQTLKSPHYVTTVCRCQWVETWKKYGLLEYGKTYCLYVDKNLVKGFNPALELDIPALQSFGDPCCIFNWGYERDANTELALSTLQTKIGEKYVRDFDYHTAHLYSSIYKSLKEQLGVQGQEICHRAMEQFVKLFGEPYRKAIQVQIQKNGWENPF
jgi:hypothetical protein